MTRRMAVATLATLTTFLVAVEAGCLAPPPQTTVNLVNKTNHRVDVQLFYHENQYLTEGLIESDGVEMVVPVLAGNTYTFSRNCEDLQAIFIKDADLRVVGAIGPEASTRVYREPGDFGCGDTLTFTFTQNALATSLEISFGQQK
jgi:hypothetical protein